MPKEPFHSSRTPAYQEYRAQMEDMMPDGTAADLNIREFFDQVNRTVSYVGHQFLYYLLRLDRPSGVEKHEALIDRLGENAALQKELTDNLRKLSHPDASSIASLFSIPVVEVSKAERVLISVCRFLPFLSLGLLIVTNAVGFIFLLLAALLLNAALHYRNKTKMREYYFSSPQLLRLLQQAGKLSAREEFRKADPDIEQVLDELKPLKKYLHAFRLNVRLDNDMAIVAFMIMEMFYIFFLTEAYFATQTYELLREKKETIERVYLFVGMLDVVQSVMQLRRELAYYCLPQPAQLGEKLYVEAIYHPLIKDCVPNGFRLTDRSAIITGSNMSGKTSFIRAIGLNFVAAKALHTCFARRFEMSTDRRISSAINLADNLMKGESFYLREVKTVKEFLEQATSSPRLFLLDELFKGTNTAERIAISKAVLSYLAQGDHIVLASTHDLELTSLLADEYEFHYFTETVRDGQLLFDYQLKPGVLKERNAIRILEINGYPAEVIREAYAVVGK